MEKCTNLLLIPLDSKGRSMDNLKIHSNNPDHFKGLICEFVYSAYGCKIVLQDENSKNLELLFSRDKNIFVSIS